MPRAKAARRCRFCQKELPADKTRAGRPRLYCSTACSQANYRWGQAGIKRLYIDEKGALIRPQAGGRLALIDRLAQALFEHDIKAQGWYVADVPDDYRDELLNE